MANTISPISFPAAVPGADSARVLVQKGVRYIGRVDTDGPAVWEAICVALGVDSLGDSIATLHQLFAAAVANYLRGLPLADPGVRGAAFLNGNFVNVDTEGTTPVDTTAVPIFVQALVNDAVGRFFAGLTDTAPGQGVGLDGSFVVVGADDGS